MEHCIIDRGEEGYHVSGHINFDTVTHLYHQGVELLGLFNQVQLDFSKVDHVDSSAIALLLNWLRYANKRNKRVIFANLPSQLLEIANVCEVLDILQPHMLKSDCSVELSEEIGV